MVLDVNGSALLNGAGLPPFLEREIDWARIGELGPLIEQLTAQIRTATVELTADKRMLAVAKIFLFLLVFSVESDPCLLLPNCACLSARHSFV